jgi:AraC-like DNA-binding protein
MPYAGFLERRQNCNDSSWEPSEMAVQRDPVREWREHYARCCLHLDFAPLNDATFHASVTPIFKELPVVRTELSPGFVFRDEDLVRDGDNNFGFLISRSRALDNTHQGREVRLGLGDATMMQANQPGRVGSCESFGFFEVMIPPAEWDARGARPSDALMQRFWGKSDAMQLLRGYIHSLEKMGLAASFDGLEIVRRHIIDLVVLAATRHRHVGESSASAVVAARRATALDQITSSFQDPELSLATVAHDLRISPRYLQRLLEISGTSFTAYVNELRLQRAFTLLTEARGERRISDIALQVGFSDISHFNRLFRARFGDTPRGVRGQRQ